MFGQKMVFGVSACLVAALFAQPVSASAQAPPASGSPASGPSETVIVVLSSPCQPGATTCAAQGPVIGQLQSAGASVLSTTSLVDTITARVSSGEAQALASFPGVSQVVPDSTVPVPAPIAATQPAGPRSLSSGQGFRSPGSVPSSAVCGTEQDPELEPEALQAIGATQALASGYDGAGVTVAFLADGLDPTDPDFQRNSAYGSPDSPVITSYQDFSGDGTNAPTDGSEAFGDASSIDAQGNTAYNLSEYVNPGQAARLPAGGCWVKIVGDAPGSNLMALKVFPQIDDETTSAFLQAIQYAVQNGVKVINESLGATNFPDTSLDVIRDADDAAVAAGVTVVVSAGDAGVTSTIGSPASDPNVISVGASTTFRAYAQSNYGGFDNPAVGNGRWVSGNISALSSGGFTQAGNTVDLVAPGDVGWALCSTKVKIYSGCADIFGGTDNGIQLFGGTSEAAPLTAGAAADVIQAYSEAHGGSDPSPALVKEILMSTATDLGAPATEQGAGLLNIAAAVTLAASMPAQTGGGSQASQSQAAASQRDRHLGSLASQPGLLVNPGQVNFAGTPGVPESEQISLTNPGSSTQHVELATRALTDKVYDSGVQQFDMNPASITQNSGTFPIWSGVTEVYQVEHFRVPRSDHDSRLVFSTDYQDTGQNSVLHVALFEPDGTYAGYTSPQGLADFGEAEVANPPPGHWTALFFTELNGATSGGIGTSGPVQWDASVWQYAPFGSVSPSSLNVAPGQTATATLSVTTPAAPGDTSLSVVVSEGSSSFGGAAFGQGATTTVPVTIRTTVPLGRGGGTFSGVLTGGNGRAGVEAETNTYSFQVPPGETNMEASVALANDPGEELIAYLVDPDGQTVGYTSNYTSVPFLRGFAPAATQYAEIYHLAPEAGTWQLVLEWENPVTGNELAEPFTGAINFDQVRVSSNLPDSASRTLLTSTAFQVRVDNTGVAPEAFFVDPRLTQTTTVALVNMNPAVTATSFTIPLPAGLSFPYYVVPTHTTELIANVARTSGSAPVTFDLEYFPGDPDVSPALAAPGVTSSNTAASSNITLSGSPELSPGLWLLNPDEVGPYPATGEPTDTASASLAAVTQAFDPSVTSDTDDFWQVGSAFSNFLYLLPGQSGKISVDITPQAPSGTVDSGVLYVDDFVLASFSSSPLPDGDELAAIPYTYKAG